MLWFGGLVSVLVCLVAVGLLVCSVVCEQISSRPGVGWVSGRNEQILNIVRCFQASLGGDC